MGEQLVTEAITYATHTNTRDEHPFPQQNLNLWSHQLSRPML